MNIRQIATSTPINTNSQYFPIQGAYSRKHKTLQKQQIATMLHQQTNEDRVAKQLAKQNEERRRQALEKKRQMRELEEQRRKQILEERKMKRQPLSKKSSSCTIFVSDSNSNSPISSRLSTPAHKSRAQSASSSSTRNIRSAESKQLTPCLVKTSRFLPPPPQSFESDISCSSSSDDIHDNLSEWNVQSCGDFDKYYNHPRFSRPTSAVSNAETVSSKFNNMFNKKLMPEKEIHRDGSYVRVMKAKKIEIEGESIEYRDFDHGKGLGNYHFEYEGTSEQSLRNEEQPSQVDRMLAASLPPNAFRYAMFPPSSDSEAAAVEPQPRIQRSQTDTGMMMKSQSVANDGTPSDSGLRGSTAGRQKEREQERVPEKDKKREKQQKPKDAMKHSGEKSNKGHIRFSETVTSKEIRDPLPTPSLDSNSTFTENGKNQSANTFSSAKTTATTLSPQLSAPVTVKKNPVLEAAYSKYVAPKLKNEDVLDNDDDDEVEAIDDDKEFGIGHQGRPYSAAMKAAREQYREEQRKREMEMKQKRRQQKEMERQAQANQHQQQQDQEPHSQIHYHKMQQFNDENESKANETLRTTTGLAPKVLNRVPSHVKLDSSHTDQSEPINTDSHEGNADAEHKPTDAQVEAEYELDTATPLSFKPGSSMGSSHGSYKTTHSRPTHSNHAPAVYNEKAEKFRQMIVESLAKANAKKEEEKKRLLEEEEAKKRKEMEERRAVELRELEKQQRYKSKIINARNQLTVADVESHSTQNASSLAIHQQSQNQQQRQDAEFVRINRYSDATALRNVGGGNSSMNEATNAVLRRRSLMHASNVSKHMELQATIQRKSTLKDVPKDVLLKWDPDMLSEEERREFEDNGHYELSPAGSFCVDDDVDDYEAQKIVSMSASSTMPLKSSLRPLSALQKPDNSYTAVGMSSSMSRPMSAKQVHFAASETNGFNFEHGMIKSTSMTRMNKPKRATSAPARSTRIVPLEPELLSMEDLTPQEVQHSSRQSSSSPTYSHEKYLDDSDSESWDYMPSLPKSNSYDSLSSDGLSSMPLPKPVVPGSQRPSFAGSQSLNESTDTSPLRKYPPNLFLAPQSPLLQHTQSQQLPRTLSQIPHSSSQMPTSLSHHGFQSASSLLQTTSVAPVAAPGAPHTRRASHQPTEQPRPKPPATTESKPQAPKSAERIRRILEKVNETLNATGENKTSTSSKRSSATTTNAASTTKPGTRASLKERAKSAPTQRKTLEPPNAIERTRTKSSSINSVSKSSYLSKLPKRLRSAPARVPRPQSPMTFARVMSPLPRPDVEKSRQLFSRQRWNSESLEMFLYAEQLCEKPELSIKEISNNINKFAAAPVLDSQGSLVTKSASTYALEDNGMSKSMDLKGIKKHENELRSSLHQLDEVLNTRLKKLGFI